MSRRELVERAAELVQVRMSLRPPQAAALRQFADLLIGLPQPLHKLDPDTLREYMSGGEWSHFAHPSFTIALATGVGKTRLAGAIMALLWLTQEAQTFLFLAPSRAVLDRLRSGFDPRFREYIFVEQNLVPEPSLILADQLDDPIATGRRDDLIAVGPTVYLLTPQLIATSNRFRERYDEFSPISVREYLRGLDDLVVLMDEAHHGGGIGEKDAAAWTAAIRELEPRLQIGLTATPRRDRYGQLEKGVNVLYDYPLRQALQEGLYTKKVDLLVRHFAPGSADSEEIDEATMRFALERLDRKSAGMAEVDRRPFPHVKPVAVFFCEDTKHAEEVYATLTGKLGVPDHEVLLTHSQKSKSLDEQQLLTSIESPTNPVRVVVNVQELVEGWDVNNVYVIAPLRNVASFTFAIQAMGRGLRLPGGRRVGVPLVDSLEVLCFGRQTLEEIVEAETDWSDRPTGGTITTKSWTQPERTLSELVVPARAQATLHIHDLELCHDEVSVELQPEAFGRIREVTVASLEVGARVREVGGSDSTLRLNRARFVAAATSKAIERTGELLSDALHGDAVGELIEAFLEDSYPEEELIPLDPVEVGTLVAREIKTVASRRRADYEATGEGVTWSPQDFTTSVEVREDGQPPVIDSLPSLPSEADFDRTQLYAGWTKSAHAAYTFDSWPEARLARLLDRSSAVVWWLRNEPRRVRVDTRVGTFSPDFIVELNSIEGTRRVVVLEVKGDVFWEPPESRARLAADAAVQWCAAQSKATDVEWSFGLALESLVKNVSTLEEVVAGLLPTRLDLQA